MTGILPPLIASALPELIDAQEFVAPKVGVVPYEPFRRVSVQWGDDPNDLTPVDPILLRGSMSLSIETGEISTFGFTMVDIDRSLLSSSAAQGLPGMYGKVIKFEGGYAVPDSAHKDLFIGYINKVAPTWKANGEVHVSFFARGQMARESWTPSGPWDLSRRSGLLPSRESCRSTTS
jgi:hypothetical protein